MKKSRFDPRNWNEIVGILVSQRTSVGDSIKLTVKYNGNNRPTVTLEFSTFDPDKKMFSPTEEITEWLDPTPYYDIIDDTTGTPISGEQRRGSSSWREYIDIRFGPEVKSIVNSGGRNFSYEVIE